MMNNVMLFIIMLGLFVQFAGDKMPGFLKKNKELLMQLIWLMLFVGCFWGWKINETPEVKPIQPKPRPTRREKEPQANDDSNNNGTVQ